MTARPAPLGVERAAADAALEAAARALLDGVPPLLAEPVRYALAGDGKRLRPILCAMSYRALGGSSDAIHQVGAAIEIIHTYSLVHDDLPCMDDDDLRRGRPTAHRAFDARRATVAGAFMIPLAVRQLLRGADALALPPATRSAMVHELTHAAGAAGMVGGQWLDLAGAERLDALTETHRRKTGALMAASMALGALAAGAAPHVLSAFRSAGEQLGLAFQIHDDVLDETATAEVLGKTAGKDRASAKATYTLLLGVDEARDRAADAAAGARRALTDAGVADPALFELLAFAVERDR